MNLEVFLTNLTKRNDEEKKRQIFKATGMALCVVMLTLASCAHTHIRSDVRPSIEKSELPGYFDIVRGESYQGFIVPKTHVQDALGFSERDTILRYDLSVEEIALAEKCIREQFLTMAFVAMFQFRQHQLSDYWREYIGYDLSIRGRGEGKVITVNFILGKMPKQSNKLIYMGGDSCDRFFSIEFKVDSLKGRIYNYDCMVRGMDVL